MFRDFFWRNNCRRRRVIVLHVREIQEVEEKYHTKTNGKTEESHYTGDRFVAVVGEMSAR